MESDWRWNVELYGRGGMLFNYWYGSNFEFRYLARLIEPLYYFGTPYHWLAMVEFPSGDRALQVGDIFVGYFVPVFGVGFLTPNFPGGYPVEPD